MKTQNKLGQKSTGLALAFLIAHACLAAKAGELEITSIVPSTNGTKVVWTNSLPGYAFTLEARDSLSVGNWSSAPTRYRWPGLMNHWVEPGTPIPLIIAAWLPIYNVGDTLEGLLQAPYDRTLAPLYDGLHTDNQIGQALPSDGFDVLRPDYLASLLSDPNHPLRQALRENDVYHWTPVAPMHLYHCGGDTVVPPANSVVAYQTFTNNGACCVSLIDPGSPQRLDHGPGGLPSFLAAKQWFDSLRN